MIQYIATFFSQYGAVQFLRHAKKAGLKCKLTPVPRALSSSCGTCSRYAGSSWDPGFPLQDLEAVYEVAEDGYRLVYTEEDSR